MHGACENCGHQYVPDFNGGTVIDSCPSCGYRLNPNPLHSEMEMRNMPAPGENDPGGNPLKEGILADGGWQNRMKRDESFASVRTAENPYRPKPFSLWDKDPMHITAEEAQVMMDEDPRRFQGMAARSENLKNLINFHIGDKPQQSEEWRGNPTIPGNWSPELGVPGRGLITEDNKVHTWPADAFLHQQYMQQHKIKNHSACFDIKPDGQVNIQNLPGYSQEQPHHEELLRGHGLTLSRPEPEQVPQEEHDAVWASTRTRMYLPWTADTKSIESDFDVEQIIPPGPHTVEVAAEGEMNPVILQHDNPDVLDEAKQQLQSSIEKTAFLPMLMGMLAGGAARAVGARMIGSGVVSGLVRSVLGGGGGGDQQAQAPSPPTPVSQLASVHAAITAEYDHPSVNQGFEDTDDPEDVDQHEHNDGEHPPETSESTGGSDGIALDGPVGDALQEAMPALEKYFGSDESGAHDPAIQHLIEVLEHHHPGILDVEPSEDDLKQLHQHTAAGVPGIGMTPAVTPPGGGVGGQVAPNPMSSTPCPHCGALGPGAGQCPQCGNILTPQPNAAPQGVVPPANSPQPPQQYPGQIMPVAANQGPHNAEQFQAVAQFLQQNGREQEIPNLIAHPEMYSQELAQVANKPQPPEPDPDPGVPPPPPDPSQGMDPSAGMPPMPGPTAAIAGDYDDNVEPQADVGGHGEHPWVTQDGTPLQIGSQYEMYSAKYDVPDQVRIDAIKPGSIEYTLLGEYGLEHKTELTNDEVDAEGITFAPDSDGGQGDETDTGEHGDQRAVDTPHNAPAFASTKEAADNLAPKCPKCDSHTTETMVSDVDPGNFRCHKCGHMWKRDLVPTTGKVAAPAATVIPGALYPEEEKLQSENYPDDGRVVQCPHCGKTTKTTLGGCAYCNKPFSMAPDYGRTAGAKFTPNEQREFIDEPGVARNVDKLDLSHTHYKSTSQLSDDFLFGL